MLLHRARHLIDNYGIPPERCRLFVFTNALKAYIRAALCDLALPDDCVMTFDAWCGEYYQDRINKRLPWSGGSRDWQAIRQSVWEKTRALTDSDRLLDFVMVDEGQDLDRRDFETLAAVARHVTVFMDPKQRCRRKAAVHRAEFGYARALREAGLEVEISQSAQSKEDALPAIDFGTPLPKLMPYPSSKGLTFDTVLMPRLNRKFLEKIDPERLEPWLFVGITRATRWIYVSTTDGENALFLNRFRELERRNQMTIQRSTDGPGTSASARSTSAVADVGARAAGEVVTRAVVDVVQGALTEIQDASSAEEDDLTDQF